MVAAVQLVAAGYEYGYGEQMLLSVMGISWADPTAFVNDWFNENAPQPHVLFDVLTFLAESAGVRAEAYFLYWLASVVVTASAVVVLSNAWLPRRARPFELLVGAMLVTGPYFALGTFLVIHREAVPNALGGALGFLTAALLMTRRDRAALVAAGITTVVHVQHGTVVAGLLVLAWLLDRERLRRPVVRWFPLAVALILATVYGVAVLRGLVAATGDFSEICETASPGHCDPDSWPSVVVRDGVGVLLLGVLAPVLAGVVAPGWGTGRDGVWERLRAVALVAGPALVAIVALVTDLADVQPFEDLGRQYFLYRFVMVVAPFAPVGIVLALTQLLGDRPRWVAGLLTLAGAGGFVVWHLLTYATLWRFRATVAGTQRAVVLIALTIAVVLLVRTLLVRRVALVARLDRPATAALAVAAVVVLLAFGSKATGPVPLRIDYKPDDGAVQLGREIEAATPPGAVLAARPDIGWIRLMSRRAVMIDCKGVPYGGQPWDEYNERLNALGVRTSLECSNAGFAALSADDIEGLAERFGVTHVLLEPTDTAFAEVNGRWVRTMGEGDALSGVFEVPAP